MEPTAFPYRATLLAPSLRMAPADSDVTGVAAMLLHHALLEHFLPHARLALAQDEFRIADDDGALLNEEHSDIQAIKEWQHVENRRDEVLGFSLSLDPSHPLAVTLFAERASGERSEYVEASASSLSAAIAACLGRWLDERGLPPAPRALFPFTAEELLATARRAFDVLRSAQSSGEAPVMEAPEVLAVPYLRTLCVAGGLFDPGPLLALDPDNLWALHLAANSVEDIRAIIARAPNWGRPYFDALEEVTPYAAHAGEDDDEEEDEDDSDEEDDDDSDEEDKDDSDEDNDEDDEDDDGEAVTEAPRLAWLAMASILMPSRDDVLTAYANELDEESRGIDACRIAVEATRRNAYNTDARYVAVAADLGGEGAELANAERQLAEMAELIEERSFDPGVCQVRLMHANAHLFAGRLKPAIELRRAALKDVGADPESWPAQFGTLDLWERDPDILALCHGRDGWYRGEPSRSIHAWTRRLPDLPVDVTHLVRALLATGRDELAPLCFAHFRGMDLTDHGPTKLAGAEALLVADDLERALDEIQTVQLESPGDGHEAEINRLLRLAAAHPASRWEAFIARHLALGAKRLAALAARDAADFVPGLEASTVVQAALGTLSFAPFDSAWLDPLRREFAQWGIDAIDALFARWSEPTLEHADRLIAEWWPVVASSPAVDAEGRDLGRMARLLYTLVAALTRYFALAGAPPSVLAGAFRHIATEALLAIRPIASHYPTPALRHLFQTLEAAANRTGISEWLLDVWLLRLERVFDPEEEVRGRSYASLLEGCPRVAALLRGPARIDRELYLASELRRGGGDPNVICALYERGVRALGFHAADDWSEAARAALSPAEALDVHSTAARAFANTYVTQFNLLAALLDAGHAEAAFDCAVRGMTFFADFEREQETLKALWSRAFSDVPFDGEQALEKGKALLEAAGAKGEKPESIDAAVRCLRWALALLPAIDEEDEDDDDDDNSEARSDALRHLGIAHARRGRMFDALQAFCADDPAQGLKWAGHAAREAGQWRAALDAYRYVYLYSADKEDWLRAGLCGWWCKDDAAMAEAYARADAVSQGSLSPGQLSAWAYALCGVGRFKEAAPVTARLEKLAKKDAAMTANAFDLRARIALAAGDRKNAETMAAKAVATTADADSKKEFQETLDRARGGEPWPLNVKAPSAWRSQREALLAAGFRGSGATDKPVTEASLHAAEELLVATAGQLDAEASRCRIQALLVRENALFPADPPPPLATPMTPAEYDAELSRRLKKTKSRKQ